jgi:hypothetical protein
MTEVAEDVDLHLGASHAPLIGSVVCVDIDGREGRTLYTGVLHGARDEYRHGPGNELKRTTLWVGQAVVYLNWDEDDILTARISREQ